MPDDVVFIAAIIGIAQPVWMTAIAAIAWEDSAAKKAGTFTGDK